MWGQKALHPLSEPTPFNCDMGWLIEIFDNTLPRIEAVFFFHLQPEISSRTNVYRTIFCNLERREIYPFQIVLSLAINRYPICHSFSAGVGCREGFKLLAPTSRCIMFLSVIILQISGGQATKKYVSKNLLFKKFLLKNILQFKSMIIIRQQLPMCKSRQGGRWDDFKNNPWWL